MQQTRQSGWMSSLHLALAVVPGGSRMEWDHRRRGAVRIHLAANMFGNIFEERARELVDEFGVEVRATDEQEINTHGMQWDVLTRVRSAREARFVSGADSGPADGRPPDLDLQQCGRRREAPGRSVPEAATPSRSRRPRLLSTACRPRCRREQTHRGWQTWKHPCY